MVPDRILIHEPRYCVEHGWTAVLRVEDFPRSKTLPAVVSSYYPPYVWLNFTRHEAEAGPSSAAPASRLRAATPTRTPSPMAISPARSPTPVGTMATRRGQPPFYTDSMAAGRTAPISSSAPPSPPPAPDAAPRIMSIGHHQVPNGIEGHPNGDAGNGYLPSDEEEA
ncbi:unnamed protein product [Urochloa humidicola]